ncbi:hypothetical protein JTE90_017063 [Oedothorax gibbosus]|uniref:Uncharacterized protein n=1 Tax=Oedothorax gibbosus TaxID=931172 RepID=A0AAV6ULN0_9ARAC|nr:hypothetical protein JTE90_017063 [Oedothorax gibbosus]
MKFLDDKSDISDLEKGIRNKFRWEWLSKDDFMKEKISTWCKKIDVGGTCFCTCCNGSIRYASEGLKSLLNHSASATHQKARKSVSGTQYLCSKSSIESLPADRTVDLGTKKCRTDALITSFIAEHSLPFSMAPDIVELSKTLSKDMTALNATQMSRVSASL